MLVIVLYSFRERGAYGGVAEIWTAANYLRLFDPLYGNIFIRTVVMSLIATGLCVVLAFPVALFIVRSGRRKHLYLQLVLLPFWTSFLIRLYAWMFLLRDTGLVNSALIAAGVITQPIQLLYNDGAVVLGLVYGYLPFAVIPIYATLERVDPVFEEASADLGATPWQTMTRVLIPLCAPGLQAAAALVFIPCLGAFLTPDLLGGGKSVMAGNLIQNQFTTARDWPFGSAVSLALMALIGGILMAVARRSPRELS
jgi:spermidine/putrescine transport system permease protein